ncbi:MAG: hypothetical protein KF688_10270 [Pirellulales bacterium]|nr:hypothetical protein [Pirellulales bacterium]
MFSLHETDRKRICRGAFFALCVAPTCVVAAWIGAKLRPGGDGRTAAMVEARLLTPTVVDAADEPRPGVTRCGSLALSDGTTGATLASLERLLTQRLAGRQSLHVARLELPVPGLAALATAAERWLADETLVGDAAIDELTIVGGGEPVANPDSIRRPSTSAERPSERAASHALAWSLQDVRVRLDCSESDGAPQRRLTILGRVADDGRVAADAAIVKLTVVRRIDVAGQAAIVLALDAPAGELPGWVVADVRWPLASWPAARLSGVWNWNVVDGRLQSGTFAGSAGPLDVRRIVPATSVHRCSGTVRLSDATLRWSAAGVESLAGAVESDDLAASVSILRAALQSLSCTLAAGATIGDAGDDDGALIEFDRFECIFQFDETGLTAWGGRSPDATRSRALATRDGRPWLMEPMYEQVFAGSWVQFLLPPGGSWLPATREAIDAAARLPLPAAAEPR